MHTRGKSALVLAAVLGLGLAMPALAQEETATPTTPAADLPAAETLFENFVTAIGGREALSQHRNRVLYGSMTSPDSNDVQVFTIWAMAPNKLRAHVEQPALGTTVRSTDGQTAWGQNLGGTPFEITGAEKQELIDSAIFEGEAAYKDRYELLKTAGQVAFDGRPAYQVDFVTKAGVIGAVFFDAESGLMVGRRTTTGTNTNLVAVGDYTEFEGVKIPLSQQQRVNGNLVGEFRFKWVEVNVDGLPQFGPPEDLTITASAAGG